MKTFFDVVCKDRPDLEAVKLKVNPLLTAYEEYCAYPPRVSDVYVESPHPKREVLTKQLIDFVARRPLPEGVEPRRHRRRMSEDKSILRRLMREHLTGRKADAGSASPISLADISDLPTEWAALDRVLTRSRNANSAGKRGAGRGGYSLASQHLVLALRQVSREKSGELDLSVLLGDLYGDVTRKMRRNAPYPHHRKLTVEFSHMRKRYFKILGRPVPKRQEGVPFKEFPEPLKSQVERYRRAALKGFGSSDGLRRVARDYNLKEEPYSACTVDSAIADIGIGLGHIAAAKGEKIKRLGVKDLISTRPVKIRNEAGKVVEVRPVNDNTELYYRRQREAVTPSKRANFDTATFQQYRAALIAVAAVNGCEEYINDFRKGYKTRLDMVTRRGKKSTKKRVFRRPAVDGEISRLKGEAFAIIDEGSFKRKHVGQDDEAHGRMTKILLVVCMAVLRRLGYRQQCLRACKVGEHVFFNADGSIRFDFPEGVTKNRKHIRITLSPRDHGATHGELLDILWKYYREVYPYILSRDDGVDGHLFVSVSRETGNFSKFMHEEGFNNCFDDWGKTHLRYDNFPGAQENNLNLHPHFFRGLCVDWLIEDLGWSRDAVATFIGDEPGTLRDYINEHMVYDPTRLLTQYNMMLKAEEAERQRPRAEAELKALRAEYQKALRAKDEQIQELLSQSRVIAGLLDREKSEKEDLLLEIRRLRAATQSHGGVGIRGGGRESAGADPLRRAPVEKRRPPHAYEPVFDVADRDLLRVAVPLGGVERPGLGELPEHGRDVPLPLPENGLDGAAQESHVALRPDRAASSLAARLREALVADEAAPVGDVVVGQRPERE